MSERRWGRRAFLSRCGAAAAGAAGLCAIDSIPPCDVLPRPASAEDVFDFATPGDIGTGASNFPAAHWDPQPDGRVICRLCPRECRVADRERGYCGVRENVGGEYRTLVHSRAAAVHVDPVEKKPFFHVRPGSPALSLATAGCNMQCKYCQNWELSQFRPEQVPSVEAQPERVVDAAVKAGAPFIAFTYAEPVIFWEYARDIADAGNSRGLRSLMISNGYIQEKPLREIIPRLSAVKIDLKGFTESFYKEVADGELAPVLRTLRILKETGIWFEIVILVVPTLNDDEDSMRRLCAFVAETLGPGVPLHFTRFHPAYRLRNLPPTPVPTLERVHRYALDAGLQFAYLGNVPGHPAESTYCPQCKSLLVKRSGYTILENVIVDGTCPKCRTAIPGVWA